MQVPIIVVSTNRPDCIQQWIRTVHGLQAPDGIEKRPIIVDNGSWNRAPTVIAEEGIRNSVVKELDVFWLPRNLGLPKAHNHALRQLLLDPKIRYVATLNEDALADPSWLGHLLKAAESQDGVKMVGMFGGPIYQPSGAECKDYAPSGKCISRCGHRLRRKDAACLDIHWNKPTLEVNLADVKPFAPCASAALWSMEMLRKIGIFDNDQFLYYDDIELAYRARLNGWSACWVPGAKAFHPSPQPKPKGTPHWRMQQAGRLAIVHRCLPDSERVRILAELPPEEQQILIELMNSGRDLRPYVTNEQRQRTWDEWVMDNQGQP